MAESDYTPDVAAVGAILRARTKTAGGAELGTFDANTRPTGDEVTELIEQAVGETSSHVGTLDGDSTCVTKAREDARRLTARYAAMLVELSYFPEQVASGRSPYDQLERLYDKGIKTLTEQVGECLGGGGGESVGGGGQLPSYNFDTMPVIGRRTVM